MALAIGASNAVLRSWCQFFVIDTATIHVEPDCGKMFCEFNRKREPDVAEAYDTQANIVGAEVGDPFFKHVFQLFV